MPALNDRDIDARLAALANWRRENDEIRKEFTFAEFRASMAFVNRVADLANAADHHPDIDIRYSRVLIALSTHSEGGITDKDFALAQQIEAAT